MKRSVIIIVLLFTIMTYSCKDFFTPKGRYNPIDEYYEPAGDPDNEAPEIIFDSTALRITSGASIIITVTADDPENVALTYQWYIDDVLQEGEMENRLVFSQSPSTETTYTIRVKISDGAHTEERSVSVTVETTVNNPPKVFLDKSVETVENGAQITITATATDEEGDSLSYQWFVDDTEQEGATNSSFTFSATPSAETEYSIKVAVSDGISTTEESASITVGAPGNEAPQVSINETDQNLSNGETFLFTATGNDNNGDELTYQWYIDNVLQDGETGTSYTFAATPDSDTDYILKVIVSDGSLTAEGTVSITVYAPGAMVPPSLLYNDGGSWQSLPTPAAGTIDLCWGDNSLHALTSDGTIQHLDSAWMETGVTAPEGSRALTSHEGSLWVYTSNEEIYFLDGMIWQAHASPAPANGISLGSFESTLYLLTTADLYIYDGGGWTAVGSPTGSISLALINETLYVLRNDYTIYRKDGAWQDTGLSGPEDSFALSEYDGGMAILKDN